MRLAAAAWWLQFRLLSRSPFFIGMSLMTPLAYGAVVLLMSGGQVSVRTVLGAGLMGAWSTTLFGAAEALFMQRFTGTLELLIGAPRSLVAPVFGFASATVTLGVYSVAAVTVVAFTFAHVDTGGVDVLRLTVSLLAVLVSLTSMGVLLAGLYVITRHAMEITNVLEFPMWLACGVIVPSTAIWAPISACGLLFPLGWAMLAVDQATAGGNALPVVAVAVCLSLLYAALGVACLHRVDMLARQRGTLRLR